MRIYFDYPYATEENMKAVQDAINAGKGTDELVEIFDDEVLWDCVVVLSEYEDSTWQLLENMDANAQTRIEDWQYEFIEDYIMDQREKKE